MLYIPFREVTPVVAFPRPRLSVLSRETEAERGQRWVKALTELPVRRAVLRLATGRTGTVQVAEVADPGALPGFDVTGFERFLSAAIAGSGQSAREVEQAQAWRREEAERVAGGAVPDHADQQMKSPQPGRPALRNPSVLRQQKAPEPHKVGSEPVFPPIGGTVTQETLLAQRPLIAEDGSLA